MEITRKKISVMIAENHHSVRQGYVALLETEINFAVTGQAENGYELLKLMAINEPDIVLTDLDMPVMSGWKLLEIVRIKFPKVKVVFLSLHNEIEIISEAIINGACAYLLKNCNFNEIVFTIERVYADGYYFPGPAKEAIGKIQALPVNMLKSTFTYREIQILQLICEEKSNQEIADALEISINTVSYHRQHIFWKANTKSIIGLYKYAVRKGITMPE